VLRRCASLLRNALREGDLLGCDGAGRFRALLVDTGPMGTEDVADILRRAVKVGFGGSGVTAQIQVETHDAQGEAAARAAAATAA
jgi:GGDEF domain-containing protein